MATPRNQNDRPTAPAGTTDYEAQREGTVHTGRTAERTGDFTDPNHTSGRTASRHATTDHDTTHRTHGTHRTTAAATGNERSSAAKKGLFVGIATFLALALIDWLAGPSFSAFESLTLGETIAYAIIGLIVGVVVKQIDLRRHRHDHKATHRA
jgi:hypothetical protein